MTLSWKRRPSSTEAGWLSPLASFFKPLALARGFFILPREPYITLYFYRWFVHNMRSAMPAGISVYEEDFQWHQ